MRENRVRQLLQAGKPAIGTSVPFATPEAVEFFGLLGYDFFFIDGEHQAITPSDAIQLVRAANVVGIEPVVRAPVNDPGVILTYLETGASTIVVPHCSDAEAVRRAVQAVKYPPLGNRGAGTGSRAADYGLTAPPAEYFAAANEQTLVLPMIEEPEAIRNLDGILAVEGLEALFIGPTDLSLTMGYPGRPDDPAVQREIAMVVGRARAAGISVGITARDVASTLARLEGGANLILCGAAPLLAGACRAYLQAVRR